MLEGEKIRLRAVELSDGERVQRWLNEADIQMAGRVPRALSKKALEKLYEKSINALDAAPSTIEMAVDTHDGRHIGLVQVADIDWVHRHGELHILLGEPDYKWRGFEEITIALVAAYAFRMLNLNRLSASVIGQGNRMQKCFEEAGFKVEGMKEQFWWSGEGYENEVCLRLLARDFRNPN